MAYSRLDPPIADPHVPVRQQLPDWDRYYGGFQLRFSELLRQEPAMSGRVLDIGCGGGLHPTIAHVAARCQQLDGIDPGPDVHQNPDLMLRWQSTLEEGDVPSGAYDAAISFNVVEHVVNPRTFLQAVHRVLKEGGVFWALSPHRNHPFAYMVRVAQFLQLKKTMAQRNSGINTYPAYYRLNRSSVLRRLARDVGFDRLDVHYLAAPGWYRGYVPWPLWWIPWTYDTLLSHRLPVLHQIIAFRLRKGRAES